MLLVTDVKRSRRRRMTAEQEALFGIDRLNVARSDIPAVTHVDYSARSKRCMRRQIRATTLFLQHASGAWDVRVGQCQFQCCCGADRLHTRRCIPLLHGNAN